MTCKGNDCGDLNEVWEYDPRTDRWTRKADMPETMSWSGYFVLNGKGYIGAGGMRGQKIVKNFWEFDRQTDKWTRQAEFPGPSDFRSTERGISVREPSPWPKKPRAS
jgi:N-acetylneuraminic acid mutarotase